MYTHIYIYIYIYTYIHIPIYIISPQNLPPGMPPPIESGGPKGPRGLSLARPRGPPKSLGLSLARQLTSQDGPRGPGIAERSPQDAQDGPKTPPRRPKMAPRRSKTPPRRPKRPPRGLPRGPQETKIIDFHWFFPCFSLSRLFGFPTLQDRPRSLQEASQEGPERPKSLIFQLFLLPCF